MFFNDNRLVHVNQTVDVSDKIVPKTNFLLIVDKNQSIFVDEVIALPTITCPPKLHAQGEIVVP
jgi:hypothetical protein